MRKKIYSLLLLTALLWGMTACGGDDEPAPELEGIQVAMDLPADWDDTNQFGDPVVLVGISPLEAGSDTFRENINVVTEEAPGLTLESYYGSTLEDLSNFPDFALLSSADTTVNEYEAKKIIFTFDSGQERLQLMDYIFYEQETGIVVTCTALERSFDRYEATFNQIVGTIQLQ